MPTLNQLLWCLLLLLLSVHFLSADQKKIVLGNPGSAISLPGDQGFELPELSKALPTTFTFETWLSISDSPETYRPIVSRMKGADKKHNMFFDFVLLAHQNKKFVFFMGNGINNELPAYISTTSEYQVDKWYHVALVIEQTENIQVIIYLDGKEIGTNKRGDINNRQLDQSPLLIGYFQNQDSYVHYLKGKMDEMRFWKQVRTQTQIQTYRRSPYSPSMTNLLAYYSMDDPEKRLFVDTLGRYSTSLPDKITKEASEIQLPFSIQVPWNAQFFEIILPGNSIYGKHAFQYVVTSVPSQPEVFGKFYYTPVNAAYIPPGKHETKLASNIIFYTAPAANSFEESAKAVVFTYKGVGKLSPPTDISGVESDELEVLLELVEEGTICHKCPLCDQFPSYSLK